jgi:hypothetical protein
MQRAQLDQPALTKRTLSPTLKILIDDKVAKTVTRNEIKAIDAIMGK